jgi:protein-disulfide isomerase
LPAFQKAYVDAGKVHFIFREFARNPLDVAAFVLARCEGDDKALATIDLLFAEQDKWAFVANPLDALIAALRPTGMSRDQAMTCLKDQSKADAMTKILNAAEADVKVQGTPTFVIDGKVYDGELSLAELDAILKPLIK